MTLQLVMLMSTRDGPCTTSQDVPQEVRQRLLLLDAHPDLATNELSVKALQLVAKARQRGCSGEPWRVIE